MTSGAVNCSRPFDLRGADPFKTLKSYRLLRRCKDAGRWRSLGFCSSLCPLLGVFVYVLFSTSECLKNSQRTCFGPFLSRPADIGGGDGIPAGRFVNFSVGQSELIIVPCTNLISPRTGLPSVSAGIILGPTLKHQHAITRPARVAPSESWNGRVLSDGRHGSRWPLRHLFIMSSSIFYFFFERLISPNSTRRNWKTWTREEIPHRCLDIITIYTKKDRESIKKKAEKISFCLEVINLFISSWQDTKRNNWFDNLLLYLLFLHNCLTKLIEGNKKFVSVESESSRSQSTVLILFSWTVSEWWLQPITVSNYLMHVVRKKITASLCK